MAQIGNANVMSWMIKLGIGLVLCASCTAPTASPVLVTQGSTPEIATTRLMALWSGELVIEGDCVQLGSFTLAFPEDIRATVEGRSLMLADETLGQTATWQAGQTVAMAGGEVRPEHLSEGTRDDVLSRCSERPDTYWLVGDVGKAP